MSLPKLLCVDDSEAILALERAALSAHYEIACASNGTQALASLRRELPDAVLLDLSMPGMDGHEVLAQLAKDPALRELPVVVVTSETRHAETALREGAAAFLAKPIRADELRACVERTLGESRRRRASFPVLFVRVGSVELGLPLDGIRAVAPRPLTRPLAGGPRWLSEVFELRGEPVCVLDVCDMLSLPHGEPLVERKLVVVESDGAALALEVDRVSDPVELAKGELVVRSAVGGAAHAPFDEALVGIAKTASGPVAVLSARAFLSPELARSIPAIVARVAGEGLARGEAMGSGAGPGESALRP